MVLPIEHETSFCKNIYNVMRSDDTMLQGWDVTKGQLRRMEDQTPCERWWHFQFDMMEGVIIKEPSPAFPES